MTATKAADFLPRAVLLHLLAVLGIVLAPHLLRLLSWETAAVLALMLWRLLATLRHWRPLPTWIRAVLTIGAFIGVYAQFGNFTGQHAGVALLAVMAALKLTELNSRRDVMVMVLLLYFLLVTHFLFSQEIWTVAYLLVCATLITGLLIEANHPQTALPLRVPLRMGARLVVFSLPLMAVLFVLFPRIPGPLWGLPSDSGAGRSGLTDEMTPDDIQALAQSNEVAFRVRFLGAEPKEHELYWRGPVLSDFDGRRWSASHIAEPVPPVQFGDGLYDYEMVLEPERSRWLLALDLPSRVGLPSDATLTGNYQLVANSEVRERRLYRLSSHPNYTLQPALTPRERAENLSLPRNRNPRTQELARQWRAQGMDDSQVIGAALSLFRGKDFYYTLHPPKLDGRDEIDDFLFTSHRGFCEHYSSSFTVLMRAAGIPARVVAGYQGGHKNDLGDYYVIRQSEAHAWSEVWLAGRGWVRIDPTAAVAPQRIELGLGEALEGTGDLPASLDPARGSYRLRAMLEMRWDWVNEKWNRWVLGYGADLQAQVLGQLGLGDWSNMILALTAAISIIVGVLGGLLMREFTPRRQSDPVLALWLKAQRRLARAGLPQKPGEGPQDFARRVAGARPELAGAMQRVCALYLRLRYLEEPDAAAQRELGLAVKQL